MLITEGSVKLSKFYHHIYLKHLYAAQKTVYINYLFSERVKQNISYQNMAIIHSELRIKTFVMEGKIFKFV